MGRVSLRIKEFPDDGRIWRVDWFGGIERNVQIPTEPKIQLIISPARANATNFASTNAVNDDERKAITIGVAQLPLVSIGSLWQNQRCLISNAGTSRPLNNVVISSDTTRIINSNTYRTYAKSPQRRYPS